MQDTQTLFFIPISLRTRKPINLAKSKAVELNMLSEVPLSLLLQKRKLKQSILKNYSDTDRSTTEKHKIF